METYNARIIYATTNEGVERITKEGFSTAKKATEWLSEKMVWFMMHWADINPNGFVVDAEVYTDDDTFSDLYEFHFGL